MQPLYLSRLRLRALNREVQRDLANCDSMHRRLLMAFPDQPEIDHARDHFGVLYRVESSPDRDGVDALVQSATPPDWSHLPPGYLREPPSPPKRVDGAYAAIQAGQTLIFRLRANPTKRLSDRAQTPHPDAWRGKRVELRREADLLAWLARKGQTAGFVLLTVRATPGVAEMPAAPAVPVAPAAPAEMPDVRIVGQADRMTGQRRGQRLSFGSVVFEGHLRVTDPDAFREALVTGIGSGKAFGFGLLSIAPARMSN